MLDKEWRDLAKGQYGSDDVEIDIDARVSIGEDSAGPAGAWVQAWVWVNNPNKIVCPECEQEDMRHDDHALWCPGCGHEEMENVA